MCEFSALPVVFNKATSGQTDIKHEKEREKNLDKDLRRNDYGMVPGRRDEQQKLQSGGYNKKIENRDDCLAFKKTNQNTQEVRTERFKKKKKTFVRLSLTN